MTSGKREWRGKREGEKKGSRFGVPDRGKWNVKSARVDARVATRERVSHGPRSSRREEREGRREEGEEKKKEQADLNFVAEKRKRHRLMVDELAHVRDGVFSIPTRARLDRRRDINRHVRTQPRLTVEIYSDSLTLGGVKFFALDCQGDITLELN